MIRWLVSLVLLMAANSHAATFIVTSAADTAGNSCGSVCTLRQAITAANATTAADTINFAITVPIRGELLIQPGIDLPPITQPLTINGYSQSGTRVNTSESASNALLRIRIDGAGSGSTTDVGLAVCASNTTIRGLAITRIQRNNSRGIAVGDACPNGATNLTNVGIHGNFIGVTGTGTSAAGINGIGVLVVNSTARVGQLAEDRNIVSNSLVGVEIRGGTQLKFVQNNLIGTDKTGTQDMGNGSGVLTSDNAQFSAISLNLIRFNGVGVHIASGSSHAISGNRISDSDGLGIDLGTLGVTPNDPGDADSGPNGLRNFPTITAGRDLSTPGKLSVSGTLDGPPSGNNLFRFDFFASASCDSSTHGEGERYLGTLETTRGSGGGFNGSIQSDDPLPPGVFITATARGVADTSTSEFSACITLDPPPLVVNSADDVDDGACNAAHCSLREAMLAANAFNGAGLQFINFAIPPLAGTGEIVIAPAAPLPAIGRQYRIDGYSQPGAVANTDPLVSNAVPRIRLQGGAAVPVGFRACLGATISGLALTGFADAIVTSQTVCPDLSPGVIATGNFFGLHTDGSTAAPNQRNVVVGDGGFAGSIRIGGSAPAERNVFAGGSAGVLLDLTFNTINSAGFSASVLGNLFGTDRTGTQNRGMVRGVSLINSTTEVLVGSSAAPNTFRFNATAIEQTSSGIGSHFAENRFSNHTGIAIDLGADGVDLNDGGDVDTGPNGHQNYPELTLAERNADGVRIVGTVDVPGTPAVGSLTLAFYANASCDSSGNGEGEALLTRVQTGENFDVIVATEVDLELNPFITAIATHTDGSSEFSACLRVTEPEIGIAVDSGADSLALDGGCDIVADGNLCTLREAIVLANAQPGADRIRFQIPNPAGPHTITLEALLPTITGGLTIDGYTQPGAAPNAAPEGFDAVIRIGVRPVALAHAFRICTTEQVDIIGMAFTAGTGPLIDARDNDAGDCALAGHVRVLGNQFGLTADGATSTVFRAVSANGSRLTLGGPNVADRNLLTRSTDDAVLIAGPLANGSIVQNNRFGRDGDQVNHPNARDILISSASDVVVGGEGLLANDFANSVTAIGVVGANADRNTLYANRFSNHAGATAIDLGDDGISSNDANDVDTGPNDGQNTPVLQTVTAGSGSLALGGLLDVPVGLVGPAEYRLAFYHSGTCSDGSGNAEGREGQRYVESKLHPFTSIEQSFEVTLSVVLEGGFLTATATSPEGATSEFSNCLALPLPANIFSDGFE